MKRDPPTNEIARERLRAVLESDRGFLSGKPLEMLRRDISSVMLSYMEIDAQNVCVRFERTDGGTTMVRIEVPGVRVRHPAGALDDG